MSVVASFDQEVASTKAHFESMKENCVMETNIPLELSRVKAFFNNLKQTFTELQNQENVLLTIGEITDLEPVNQEYMNRIGI